ncbi:MAG: hypothetical protein DMG59_02320 [Acidobacteria bacterium]|nr:MAG: hypothetical protein DMG59_02320 [Acidobacteriota bacterium]
MARKTFLQFTADHHFSFVSLRLIAVGRRYPTGNQHNQNGQANDTVSNGAVASRSLLRPL